MLYVTEQGAGLGIRRARLEVRKGNRILDSLRLDELEQVVLYGNVQVTTQALRALLRRRVDTVLLDAGGSFLGRLSGPFARNVLLRRRQHEALADPAFGLDLARRFVRGKLANCRTLLRRHQRDKKDDRLAVAQVALRLALERVPASRSGDELRGVEGRAAVDYFGAFPALLTAPGITFSGRKRRPPPDPVNILLSFGYTLLGNALQGMCEQVGFDPYVGSLHDLHYGRPSLALDLMEEWRPVVVDATVLRVLNTRALDLRDFVPTGEPDAPLEDAWEREDEEARAAQAEDDAELRDAGAQDPGPSGGPDPDRGGTPGRPPRPLRRSLLLTTDGVRRFIVAFERRMAEEVHYPPQQRRLEYRQVLRAQVNRLARHLKGDDPYEPFLLQM